MMILKLDSNLKTAIVFSLILNSALAFSGFYARTYDSYGHMFFADHYRRTWFDTWEPKWYMGFSVTSYPPLAHQILALLSYVTGHEIAYTIINFLLMVLLPVAVFRFSKVFVSEEAAGYSSLISVFLPGILLSVYLWGQYTTLFGLLLTLFTVPYFYKYIKKGGLLYFAELICLFEATIATHHFSGLIFTPLLLLVTFLTVLVKKELDFKTIFKRFLLFLGVGSLLSLIIIYPVLFGAVSQNVHIPHPTTQNYLLNFELLEQFFIKMYGFFLLLIPLTVIMIRYRRDLQPLFIIAFVFLILGLGGTTVLPQIIFGENWLGLTYDRFNLFSVLAFTPLFGLVCVFLKGRKRGKAFLVTFLVLSILFSSMVGNDSIFRPRPEEVPVDSIVNFLANNEHWQWRYLTLGFGAYDFCRLSILTNATTLDGWYYQGRNIPDLANSIGYISAAKFEENGIPVLRSILENSSQYHLRFVFCNDKFYEPLLNETGFRLLNESYEQVTVWAKYDSSELEINEIVKTNHVPTLLDYLWGIIPMAWLIGFFLLNIFKILRNREKILRARRCSCLAFLKKKKLGIFVPSVIAKFGSDLFLLALYLILTLVLLYPFSVLNMNTQLIGVDGGDTYQGLWNLWWVRHSVLSFTNPYTTNYIFYPIGTDLFAHSLSPVAGFFSIPFQLTLGLVFSYNLLVILSFVLAGYGAYRLSYYVTADKKASFFSGLVFGFSTYHFARAWGHLNLVSIQWIPFYVLFLLKMRKEASLNNVFLAVFFLVLSTLWADFHYAVFLGLFTLVLLVYDLLFNREQIRKFLLRLGIMIAVFFGLMALIIGPLFYGMLTGKYAYASASFNEQVNWSADLLGFFIPNSLNLFFGRYSQGIISHFSKAGIEGVVYIGYTVLTLAIFAAVKLWKVAKFWLLSAFVFVILSMGPILHVFGSSTFTSFHVNVPLPGLLLFSVLPIPRAPSRFILMAILCLAVLSAITLKHVNAWFAKLKRGKTVGLLFLVLLSVAFLAEVNMLPYPVVENTSVPAFYTDLAKMNGTFSVLDLPQNYYTNNRYMYYGTVSEKPLVGGSISRIAPTNLIFMQVFPVIGQMDYVENGEEAANWTDILLQDADMTNLNSFYFFNVKYVILHRDMSSDMAFEHMNDYLSGLLGQPVFSDEQIVAFSTNATQLRSTFAFLSNGWWNQEEWNGLATRWMDGNGTVEVVSPSSQYYNVSFNAITLIANKSLKVFLNGEEVGDFQISAGVFSPITLNGLYFRKGINELLFYSEQSFVPADVLADNSDTRRLSIAFQNVNILPQ